MPANNPIFRPAEFLLARTGVLELTDQQVVKLAAIARRADARLRALRTEMDSIWRRVPRREMGDSGSRHRMGRGPADPAQMQRFRQLHEQAQTDLRDAIAALTPEQQAKAWEMVASRGRGPMGPGRMRMGERGGPGPHFRRDGPPGSRRDGPRPGDEEEGDEGAAGI
jgi:hypothetical protein